jgi:hypothetical protein
MLLDNGQEHGGSRLDLNRSGIGHSGNLRDDESNFADGGL